MAEEIAMADDERIELKGNRVRVTTRGSFIRPLPPDGFDEPSREDMISGKDKSFLLRI